MAYGARKFRGRCGRACTGSHYPLQSIRLARSFLVLDLLQSPGGCLADERAPIVQRLRKSRYAGLRPAAMESERLRRNDLKCFVIVLNRPDESWHRNLPVLHESQNLSSLYPEIYSSILAQYLR